MSDEPIPTLVTEQTLLVGNRFHLDGMSPSTQYCVVFEDDGDTGYFYGLDTTIKEQPILDAMHIYNVDNVVDAHLPSLFQIVWSADGLKAALFINDYPHAVFDFESRRGYCRSNFPPPDRKFTQHSHEWSDSALQWF